MYDITSALARKLNRTQICYNIYHHYFMLCLKTLHPVHMQLLI